MNRIVASVILVAFTLTSSVVIAIAADLKVVHTRAAKDVVVTILTESGQLTQGTNTFVLEFTSASTKQPLDVGKASLETSMTMPGMAPMLAGATLSPDKAPGRYLGTISFPDRGRRQVTVRWDGPAGVGMAKFSVPVR